MNDLQSSAVFEWLVWAGLFIALPAGIGFLMGASWKAILGAFAALALLSCLLGFPAGDNWDHRIMWAAIFWMIGCIPGIPLILFIMRLAGIR